MPFTITRHVSLKMALATPSQTHVFLKPRCIPQKNPSLLHINLTCIWNHQQRTINKQEKGRLHYHCVGLDAERRKLGHGRIKLSLKVVLTVFACSSRRTSKLHRRRCAALWVVIRAVDTLKEIPLSFHCRDRFLTGDMPIRLLRPARCFTIGSRKSFVELRNEALPIASLSTPPMDLRWREVKFGKTASRRQDAAVHGSCRSLRSWESPCHILLNAVMHIATVPHVYIEAIVHIIFSCKERCVVLFCVFCMQVGRCVELWQIIDICWHAGHISSMLRHPGIIIS